jgi:hypothetical protein
MTLRTNVDVATRELSTSELESVSAGLRITHGPNPPIGGQGGYHPGGDYHHGGYHHGGYPHRCW